MKDMLHELVLFQSMTEIEDHFLIKDPTFDHVDLRKAADAGRVDQNLLN